VAPATLVVASSGLWAWAGTRISGPWFIPDEVIYAELGKSLYGLGHFEILGARPSFFSLVYPLFVGLPLHVGGVERGYPIAKALQALAMSLASVPIYFWSRSLVTRPFALLAAALTLALPALTLTGFLMTEVLFYPLFCLSAWLMARALVQPTLTRQALLIGSILLVTLTRLEGLLLVPAFVIAAVVAAGFSRIWLSGLLRLTPALATLMLAAFLWLAVSLASGHPPLGAYEVTVSGNYGVPQALRFVLYHAADLILLTGGVPVAALVFLTSSVVQRRETTSEVLALLAVTIGTTLTFVPFVAVYAAGFTGRLAERNLFFLAPLFFTVCAAWIGRGAFRSARLLAFTAAALLALVLATPWDRFVVPAGEPDALTLVPFVNLHGRFPHLAPTVAIAVFMAALLALLVAPRRLLPLVPVCLGLLLTGASVSAARFAASTADDYEGVMAGSDRSWIDKAARGPVDFLYSGEQSWSGGGPAWTSVFWNERIARVDELFGTQVVGPSGGHDDDVAGDGRVLTGAQPPRLRYIVASTSLRLVGDGLVTSPTGFVLWRIVPPLRLVTRVAGIDPVNSTLGPRADLIVYGCRGGTAHIRLLSPDDRRVQIGPSGATGKQVLLTAGVPWEGEAVVPTPQRPGKETCDLSLQGTADVQALELSLRAR
jgi:Dolichyl-phosphate-mannose-protein mannosyltransferase